MAEEGLSLDAVRQRLKEAFPQQVFLMIYEHGQAYTQIVDYGDATGVPALVVMTDALKMLEIEIRSITDAPAGKGLFLQTSLGLVRFAPLPDAEIKQFIKDLEMYG